MDLSITLLIIIVTSIVSFIAFSNRTLQDKLIFYPPAVSKDGQWYRFITCGFIHADMPHLIFNMYALYIFGAGNALLRNGVEYEFIDLFGEKGRLLYLLMYLSALFICLIPTYSKNKENYYYRSLGASGAVSAVIFAQIILNPTMLMGLIFIPLYVAGFIFGIIYLAVSYWLDKKNTGTVNHSAHIWGALYGIVFLLVFAKLFSDFPLVQEFIDTVKSMRPENFIHWGM